MLVTGPSPTVGLFVDVLTWSNRASYLDKPFHFHIGVGQWLLVEVRGRAICLPQPVVTCNHVRLTLLLLQQWGYAILQ